MITNYSPAVQDNVYGANARCLDESDATRIPWMSSAKVVTSVAYDVRYKPEIPRIYSDGSEAAGMS